MNQITEVIKVLWDWASSSTAAGVSFGLTIVMLFLAIFGFIMYFRQKREYCLLFEMLKEYELHEKIRKDKSKTAQEYKKLEQEKRETQKQIEEAYRDLKERLPMEAKRAYYENTIPVVQKQIFDLAKQLEGMTEALQACGGQVKERSLEIDTILSEEIRRHLSIRRDMERAQMLLVIFMGGAAAMGLLLPYPLSTLAIPLGVVVARQCLLLYKLWKTYYRW